VLCSTIRGHAAFSHVSELALESLPGINTLSFKFSQLYKVEGWQLSEIFAFYVIRSPALRSFFDTMLDIEATSHLLESVSKICN
jgi:deoxynucleoside triphosphate triphosphohydrolase SAMHD1